MEETYILVFPKIINRKSHDSLLVWRRSTALRKLYLHTALRQYALNNHKPHWDYRVPKLVSAAWNLKEKEIVLGGKTPSYFFLFTLTSSYRLKKKQTKKQPFWEEGQWRPRESSGQGNAERRALSEMAMQKNSGEKPEFLISHTQTNQIKRT